MTLLQPGIPNINMLKMRLEELLSFTEAFLVAILFPDVFQCADNLLSNYFCYAGHTVF